MSILVAPESSLWDAVHGAWLSRRMLEDTKTNFAIEHSIKSFGLPEKDFRALARLHLPILYHQSKSPFSGEVTRLLDNLAGSEATAINPYLNWFDRSKAADTSVRSLSFGPLPQHQAEIIFSQFHYIRSMRLDSENWALYDGAHLVAAASVSPCDLCHLGRFPNGIKPGEVAILSRVYAFPNAPKNTLSYLFSKVSDAVLSRGKRLMITYVNPNLGFTGVSYRAANWSLFGYEHGTRYQYLDGKYVTDRNLKHIYATDNPVALHAHLGERIISISEGLAPLWLFAYYLDPRERNNQREFSVRSVKRPT